MKAAYIYLLLAITFFASCKEEPPGINYKPDATTLDSTSVIADVPVPQLKEVLLEDISGVKCINCPEAAEIADNIITSNPGRVNLITTQPNTLSLKSFCSPINDGTHTSKYDFRTQAAADILNAVAIPGSLPSGFIDRQIFSPNLDQVVARADWVTSVNAELPVTTPVNITVSAKFDATTSNVTTDVLLIYTGSQPDSNYLSISVVEDNITDLQEKYDPSGTPVILTNYVHHNVLLDMITASTGDLLNKAAGVTLAPGRVFVKRYTAKITPKADPKNLKVIVYVHKGPSGKFYVLQSKEADVK